MILIPSYFSLLRLMAFSGFYLYTVELMGWISPLQHSNESGFILSWFWCFSFSRAFFIFFALRATLIPQETSILWLLWARRPDGVSNAFKWQIVLRLNFHFMIINPNDDTLIHTRGKFLCVNLVYDPQKAKIPSEVIVKVESNKRTNEKFSWAPKPLQYFEVHCRKSDAGLRRCWQWKVKIW